MTSVAGEGCNANFCPVGTTSFESGGVAGALCGAILTPAAAVATLNVYAGQSATGNPILTLQAAASGDSVPIIFPQHQPHYKNGFTAVVTGTGAVAQVYSKPKQ